MGPKATCRRDLGGYKDGLGFQGLRLESRVYIIGFRGSWLRVLGDLGFILKGSSDMVTRVLVRVAMPPLHATPIEVLISILAKSLDHPSRVRGTGHPRP